MLEKIYYTRHAFMFVKLSSQMTSSVVVDDAQMLLCLTDFSGVLGDNQSQPHATPTFTVQALN